MRPRLIASALTLVAGGLVVQAALGSAAVAHTTTTHAFTASYTGHGSGQVSGTRASGSATLTGRGSIIGRGTLTGSASGVFVSRTCLVFNGSAVLEGRPGLIRLATHRARACAGGTDPNAVSFSGSAPIVGGGGMFAAAHGTLSFTGTYLRQSGAVTLSLRGSISF